MQIEIDQSGKVEDTSKNTVVAFSNGKFRSILLRSQDKREIQKFFRKIGKPKIFVYRIFVILIAMLIKDYLREIKQIIIDEEYPGQGIFVKESIIARNKKTNPNFQKENITFKRIGKKSRAHFLAYGVAIGKKKSDLEVGTKEILRKVTK